MNDLQNILSERVWFLSDHGRNIITAQLASLVAQSVFKKEIADRRNQSIGFGQRIEGTRYSYRAGKVGLLDVYGVLASRDSFYTTYFDLSQEFTDLESNPEISDIVLLLDTPGGMVTGLSEFASQIANSKKRVIAHPIGMACSAGYFIASQANEIVAVDSAEVGCIGTVCTFMDFSGLYENLGIKSVEIVSAQSPRKRLDLTTPEGQADLQALVDADALLFETAVARGLGVDLETVRSKFGQGASFIAGEAMARGMIHRVSSTSQLLTELNNKLSTPSIAARKGSKMAKTSDEQIDLEAAKETAVKEAIEKERARTAAIDAVLQDYVSEDRMVVDAVRVVVDAGRSRAEATAEQVSALAAKAAFAAQKQLSAERLQPGRDLADKVKNVDTEDEEDKKKVSADRVKSLVDVIEGFGGRIK